MNTTLYTSRIAPNLEAARKLFAVPVFYKDNPQYDDAANHDNILRGPTMRSNPTAWSPGANAYAQNLYLPRVPLLTPDEEGGLFLRYNFYKRKLRLLQEQFNIAEPPDSAPIEFQRLDAAARADRSTLLEANLRLVVKLAMEYVLPQLTLEELTAEGSIHMLKVIDNFDVNLGYKFSTYATWALKRHFGKYRAKEARHRSRYRQSEVCEGAGGRAHHEPVGEEARCALLGEKLASIMGIYLTERERVVVRGRFGIGTSEAKTLAQLGEELELSKERVRQLETSARSKLLRALIASPEVAALIPDHMVREFESAQESRRKEELMTLCASLILSSGVRKRDSMKHSELFAWCRSLPKSDKWLSLFPSALETLQRLGVVEVRRHADHVAYALSPSALEHVRGLNETAKKQSMGVIREYLYTLAPSVSGPRTSAS